MEKTPVPLRTSYGVQEREGKTKAFKALNWIAALSGHSGLASARRYREEYMSALIKGIIQEMVDLETKGWDTKNPDLFLSMIHPDMAWPFPPTADSHDPIDWVFVMGRFDKVRWRKDWQDLFDTHDLIHNHRKTVKIEISNEQDAAFAVVDIDTLWRHKVTNEESHWKGRVCKIYTKLPTGEWKFYYQTGALNFPPRGT